MRRRELVPNAPRSPSERARDAKWMLERAARVAAMADSQSLTLLFEEARGLASGVPEKAEILAALEATRQVIGECARELFLAAGVAW